MILTRKIKKWIKSKDSLYAISLCIMKRKDHNLFKLIKNYYLGDYNNTALIVTNNGDMFPEDNIYHIKIYKSIDAKNEEGQDMGICAALRATCKLLNFADSLKLFPVVEWGNSSRYYDSDMDSITTNVFEYYFEPVSKIDYREAKHGRIVIDAAPGNGSFLIGSPSSYDVSQKEINVIGNIYKRYIRLNRTTKEYIDEYLDKILNSGTILAVHARGTDYNLGMKNHPKIVNPEEYLIRAKEVYVRGKYDKIFLATDDENILELFREQFKEKLLYYEDVFRSKNHIGAHVMQSDRPLHHYKLGLEVLRDVYTLANCDALLCGLSQVSFAARYVNIAINRKFNEVVILDKGINVEDTLEAKNSKHQFNRMHR